MNYQALKRKCQLEQKIIVQIYNDNKATAHFDYQGLYDQDKKTDGKALTLITSNSNHKELFTLYTTKIHQTELECLDEVIDYLDSIKKKDNGHFNYQIIWFRLSEPSERFTSYFTGTTFLEIIDKFYENKDPKEFIIVSTEMKPIA